MAADVKVDLIVDPRRAIEGIDQVSGKAEGASKFLAGLGGAVAGAAAAAAASVAAAAGGLTAATVSAASYADEILTASKNTGIATDTLQAYRYAAEQIDVSFETFTASQGKFIKSMNAAREGTGAASDAFAALGLSTTDASGNLVDSTDLYWQAIDALGNVSNETERTALAQALFGKGAAEMNSLIAQGSDGFAELTAQARANGAIMSGPQLEALGEFDDKLQAVKSTVDAAKNALGLTLLPILDDLAGSGTSALGQFTSELLTADGDMSKAAPAFESLGTSITQGLVSAVPKVLAVATSLVSGLVSGIVAQAPSLIDAAVPLLVTFAIGILGMLPQILDAGVQVLVALVTGIAAALPQLIPAAISAVIGLVTALVANLPLLLDAGLQLIIGLVTGIVQALPQLIAALPGIIIGIVTFLVNAIPTIIDAGISLFLALIDALPDVIIAIVDAIPLIITGIITALVDAIPKIIDAGIRLFIALIENLPTIITTIIGAIPQIITGIVEALGGSIPQIVAMGGQLISGLWKGMEGAAGWLWSKVQGLLDGLVGGIKDFFGIASPSKLFETEVGRMLGLGMAKGIIGSAGAVESAMRGLTMIPATADITLATAAGSDFGARAMVRGSFADGGATSTVTPRIQEFNTTFNIESVDDPRLFARQFGRSLAEQMAGAA